MSFIEANLVESSKIQKLLKIGIILGFRIKENGNFEHMEVFNQEFRDKVKQFYKKAFKEISQFLYKDKNKFKLACFYLSIKDLKEIENDFASNYFQVYKISYEGKKLFLAMRM